jgi:hypothetical protein
MIRACLVSLLLAGCQAGGSADAGGGLHDFLERGFYVSGRIPMEELLPVPRVMPGGKIAPPPAP